MDAKSPLKQYLLRKAKEESAALSSKSETSGSVSDTNDLDEWKLTEGFWVKSKTTGRLFPPDFIPNSDIDCVLIDGEWFDRSE